MKRKIYRILLIFILFLGIATVLYMYRKFSYAEKQEYYPVQDNSKKDSILKIGIIGDSWVGRTDLDKKMQKFFKMRTQYRNKILKMIDRERERENHPAGKGRRNHYSKRKMKEKL